MRRAGASIGGQSRACWWARLTGEDRGVEDVPAGVEECDEPVGENVDGELDREELLSVISKGLIVYAERSIAALAMD